jgi:hypothetical protein
MEGLVSQRLNEGQSGPTYYPQTEIAAALNEAEAFFVLLTLGLEITQPWTVPGYSPAAQNTFFRMLTVFADWICPLRIATQQGKRVKPRRLEDLVARNPQWMTCQGAPEAYAALGVDLVAVYRQPSAAIVLNVTYCRAPVPLVNPTDAPEIPAEYHPKLVDYGVYRMRQGEGAQEFEKALPLLNSFLDGATHYGNYVRSRNRGSQYDKVPFELEKFDRSQLLRLRKDLMPERRKSDG